MDAWDKAEQSYKANVDREKAYLQHINDSLRTCRPEERRSLRLDKEIVERKIRSLYDEYVAWQTQATRNLEIGLAMAEQKRRVQEAMFHAGRQPPPPPAL